MESLCSSLDVLQEKQMDLIEKNSGNVGDIVMYFELLRRELMLLCAASQRGLKRLGHTAVPPKHVCEANAKQTIEMHLAVCSLKNSVFGAEEWFLQQLSHEMYMTPPSGTFKKGGRRVLIAFDGDDENCMEYMCWDRVYVQCGDGQWTCVPSHVCHAGIYYETEGNAVYYVDFNAEALRYGTTGKWKVLNEGENITACALVSSNAKPSPDTCVDASLGHSLLQTPVGRTSNDRPPRVRRGRKRKRADTTHCDGPPPSPPPSPPPAPTPPPSPPPSPRTPPRGDDADPGNGSTLSASRSDTSTGSSTSSGGRCFSDCDSGRPRRPGTDPYIPALLIAGGPNQVKCLRHRLKCYFRGRYKDCSTTWSWVGDDGAGHTGHRICVSFVSEDQRQTFKQTVPLPKGVSVGEVDLPF
nr:MAG: E2 protein [Neophocaena asiaeorientalis asiaeorientalis papillomavirus 2]